MGLTANSKVLLVEGSDDKHVVIHLLKHHGCCQPPFHIAPKQGYPELWESIPSELKVSGRTALGILADANDSIASRWQSISDKLIKAGCGDVPTAVSHSGSVFSGPRGMCVGVWLMPDNQRNGELENFVHDMIPENDFVLPRARCYIDGIPEQERKFTESKLTRAYVHAWLATCKKPRPMGTAIEARDLQYDVPVANSFVCWLRRLFTF